MYLELLKSGAIVNKTLRESVRVVPNKKFLNIAQAAQFLGVNPGTIRRWAIDKKLHGVQIGSRGDWRFKEKDLLKLTRSNKPESTFPLDINRDYPIADRAPAMICVYNINTGVYLYANPGVKKILGYDPARFIKKGVNFAVSLVHPDDLSQIMEKNAGALKLANSKSRKVTDDSIVNFEYRMKHKNGTWKWLHTDGSIFSRDKGGKVEYVMNVSLDITDRKEREEQKANILETITDGFISFDKNWNFTYVNHEGSRIILLPPEKVIGKNLWKLFPGFEKTTFAKLFRKAVRTGKPAEIENYYLPRKMWFNLRAYPSKQGLSIYFHDITSRKKMEESIKEREHLFSTLTTHAPVGIFLTDQNGDCQFVNDKWCEIAGLSLDKAKGQGWVSALHPDDRERVFKLWYEAAKTGKPFSAEYRFLTPVGKVTWLLGSAVELNDSNGKKKGYIGTILDISENKKAHERVRESEERFRLATGAGKIGIWDWEISENHITWSDQVYEIYGIKKEDFNGTLMEFEKLIYPQDRQAVTDAIQNALMKKEDYSLEFRAFGPKKNVIWLFTSARVLFDEKGNPARMLGAVTDITGRKMEEDRKDEFIALASHELKTPVTSLKMYAHVLKNRAKRKEDSEMIQHMSRVDEQLDKLTSLVKDLLDVSRIKQGKIVYNMELFDLKRLIRETVADMSKISNSHKIVKHEIRKILVEGDRERIRQVIVNFITNAVKYSPHSKKIILGMKRKNGDVKIFVRDAGIGISKEHLNRVFERFYQVKLGRVQTYPGLGLGLYISKEIIDRHNGKIWAKSNFGKGSTFYFSLPLPKVN